MYFELGLRVVVFFRWGELRVSSLGFRQARGEMFGREACGDLERLAVEPARFVTTLGSEVRR